MKPIYYRDGYRYQLAEDFDMHTPIRPMGGLTAESEYITLTGNNRLYIKAGYAWNGANFVADRPGNMRAALVHDALYQLMRLDLVDRRTQRRPADRLFVKMCREDGIGFILARAYAIGLWVGGKPSTMPTSSRAVLMAPK